jgi:hypothetical protein
MVATVLVGLGSTLGGPGHTQLTADPANVDARIVYDYCSYGAVSKAQLNGCLGHVTPQQIFRLRTHAAQFGFGKLDHCLADAGPFCSTR